MGPTEIVVDITTNACQSLLSTQIYVDGTNVVPDAGTPPCPIDPTATVDLGTITVLPKNGIDSHVDITVVGNVGGTCDSPDTTDPQCIVARRSLSFNPHQRLDLPIFLDSACAGHACPEGQTCVVDSTGAHCGNSTCGTSDSPACFDGGIVDAGGFDVITIDSGPPPACPSIVPPNLGKPTFSWSFDKIATTVDEDNVAFTVPFSGGASILAIPPIFCNSPYLRAPNGQPLASPSINNVAFQQFNTKSFVVGFAFDASSGDATLISLAGTSTQAAGFSVVLVGGTLQIVFGITTVYANPSTIALNGWHRFAMNVVTMNNGTGNGDQSTIMVYVDGNPAIAMQTKVAYAPGSPVSFNAGNGEFDDISFYSR
jgi:hypothetical protein